MLLAEAPTTPEAFQQAREALAVHGLAQRWLGMAGAVELTGGMLSCAELSTRLHAYYEAS